MCYEALNDVGQRKTRMIIILNDNEMSIDKNVGALSQHLTHMRTSRGWLGTKKVISEALVHLPLVGKSAYRLFRRVKNSVRNVFVKDRFFSSLGIRYFGPIDGHDLQEMERVLRRVKEIREPVVVHVVTSKGKGDTRAEEKPAYYHGVSPAGKKAGASFGTAAGQCVTRMAAENQKICVVTAAMTDSTGFGLFRQQYPDRLYDVGIAEEHAVTLAAGLAAGVILSLIQQHFGIIKMPGHFLVQAYPIIISWADILMTCVAVASIGYLIAILPVLSRHRKWEE
jgi:1-deoxy-D-xylulose-5-phosphate synthase